MDTIFQAFHQAQYHGSGPGLAATISPIPPSYDPTLLRRFYNDSNEFAVETDIQHHIRTPQSNLSKAESTAWKDIYIAYWKAIGEILRAETGHHRHDWAIKVYEAWKEVANLLIRGYSHASFGAWTMPCLYTAGKYLRIFAIKADEEQAIKVRTGELDMEGDALGDDIMPVFEKNAWLEDAARVINRVFTLCISDRAPIEESRKWGLYHTTNLLFKTYFKLNSISLSKNCLRALEAARADMPPMEAFPRSHIVTFKYYVGVIHFLDEEYHRAEEHLTSAWQICHKSAHRNKELLLTYLIPTHLHTSLTLPSPTLLPPTSPLSPLFTPLLHALRLGSLSAFTAALLANEHIYVTRRIYLSLERARELCLRNLLRKIWLLQGGKEGSGRVKVAMFAEGVRWSLRGGENGVGEEERVEDEEVECWVANLIYRGLLKGYISHEHGTVVINRKGEAFPGTGV
ncbi:MAG: hypothetical protein Q9184_005159 [Pyrenodesmia sp. 2 TL-2023]